MKPMRITNIPLAEIERAQRRVGGTAQRPMKWLLEFIQETDLSRLAKDEWFRLQSEMRMFIVGGTSSTTLGNCRIVVSHEEDYTDLRLPTAAEIKQYQIMGELLLDLLARDTQYETDCSVRFKLKNPMANVESLFYIHTPTPLDAFEITSMLLLGKFYRSLRRCKDQSCQKWFLPSRTDQRYDSRRCVNRAMTRRHRKTPPDRIGKRGRPKGSPNKPKVTLTKNKGGSNGRKKSGNSRTAKRVR
jgi:hypothetical protein